jgi:hypothetical protein
MTGRPENRGRNRHEPRAPRLAKISGFGKKPVVLVPNPKERGEAWRSWFVAVLFSGRPP